MNFKKMITAAAALTIMTSAAIAPAANNTASILAPSAISASAVRSKSISQEKSFYKQGEYWNHGIIDKSSNKPCNHLRDGIKNCNRINRDHWQCEGFAEKIAYDIYGSYPHGYGDQVAWKTELGTKGYSKVKRGDVIRDYNAPHSFMIINVSGNNLIVGECNEGNQQCKINWTRPITKSSLNRKGIEIYYAPYEARFYDSDDYSTESMPALGSVWIENDTYIFNTPTKLYKDKACKTTKDNKTYKSCKIKRFYRVGNRTIGKTTDGYYVILRENENLKVRAFVTTYDKTGVNCRYTANGTYKTTIPYNRSIRVTKVNGNWAFTPDYNGWVWLNICRG